MTTFRLNIVFEGIDFDDDITFEALETLSNVFWRTQGTLAFATVITDSNSPVEASNRIVRQVKELVPTARPIKLDEDLVSISDIAGRIEVSREAVRNWANGVRQSNFPIPKGIVGNEIKVWAWSSISEWLNINLSLGDKEEFPTESEIAQVNVMFSNLDLHLDPGHCTWHLETHIGSPSPNRKHLRAKPNNWIETSDTPVSSLAHLEHDVDVAA